MAEQRGTALMEVPVESLAAEANVQADSAADEPPRRYPRRTRMPTLEFWRNERVIYKRLPGSDVPSVSRVQLNCAPRPEGLPEREIPAKAMAEATPIILDGQEAEFVSVNTDTLVSKLVVLPPWEGRVNPPTYVLPPFSKGQIFVIEGSIRYAQGEFEDDKAILSAGDHLMLPADEHLVLLATAGPKGAENSDGAKFKVFLLESENTRPNDEALPLGFVPH
jgi:hypothetical protein